MDFGLDPSDRNSEVLSPIPKEVRPMTSSPPFTSTLSPLAVSSSSKKKYQRDTSMVTTRRPRPTTPMGDESPMETRLSPDAKRLKFQETSFATSPVQDDISFRIEYPSVEEISAPSKSMLKSLIHQALKHSDNESSDDQAQLNLAGILSLEQVLLPAIALQEEQALKRVQAKIQRDAPDYKSTVEDGRRLIRSSIRNAIKAVQESRSKRMEQQSVRRQQAVEKARQERLVRQEERARQRLAELERQRDEAQQAREQRFRSLQRQYPRNQDLWKEIVVLTRSRTQLEKEHRMWKQAQTQQQEWQKTAMLSPSVEPECSSAISQSEREECQGVIMLQDRTKTTLKDIVLASTRIQQGLSGVLTILKDSEETRQQLYKDYCLNHRFQGYTSVRNPKNLIRFLSQED